MAFSKTLLSLFALCAAATTAYAKDETTKLADIPQLFTVETNLTSFNTPVYGPSSTILVR